MSHSHSHPSSSDCHDQLCVCGRPRLLNSTKDSEQSKYPLLDPSLVHAWQALAASKLQLQYLAMLKKHDALDLQPTQVIIHETENRFKHNGVWAESQNALQNNHVPHGQAIMNELMDECYDLIAHLQDASTDKENPVIAFQKKFSPDTIVNV
jgi:hypothetical protein